MNKAEIVFIVYKSITINRFLIQSIEKFLSNEFKVILVVSDPDNLDVKISLKNNLKVVKSTFFNGSSLIKRLNLLSLLVNYYTIGKKYPSAIFYLHTPFASHLFRFVNLFRSLNIIYFVHGFRFTSESPLFKKVFFSLIERLLAFKVTKFITINKDDYDYAISHLSSNVLKCNGVGVVINNNNFSNTQNISASKSSFVIGVVAAYKSDKGYSDVLWLAKHLRSYINVEIHCYGYGDSTWLEKKIRDQGLTNIILKGFVDNIEDHISKFDLLLHPSRREGLPVALQEAMLLRTLVLASNIRGNRDLITHGITGLLYDLEDLTGLLLIVQNIIDGKLYDIEFIKNSAYRDILLNYDRNKIVSEIFDYVTK